MVVLHSVDRKCARRWQHTVGCVHIGTVICYPMTDLRHESILTKHPQGASMIRGYATIDATAEYADHHSRVSYGLIGRTGLTVSQAGFGGYRISTGVSHHEQALRSAICSE